MSNDDVSEVLLTAINTELATMTPPRAAHDIDDAPTSGADYVETTLHRRFGGEGVRKFCDGQPITGYRLTTRAVGSTVINARVLLDRCTRALEGRRVTVAGRTSTPIHFETEDPISDDEASSYSGLIAWTFTV